MPALVFTSPDSRSGKTVVAAGLAARLRAADRNVGYIRTPAASLARDLDVVGTVVGGAAVADGANLTAALEAMRDRQVTIIESDYADAAKAATASGGKVVLVLRGAGPELPQQIANARSSLGESLRAVVVNSVPASRLNYVRDTAQTATEASGAALVGVIPQSRALVGVSVRDLARLLEPVSIVGDANRDAVVQRLMVGTMGLDNALFYFGRFGSKAAIISVNRPDLMIAALQTETLCIIAANENPVITGTSPVNPVVVARALERDIPIIVTGQPTLETIERVEQIFGASEFSGPGKIQVARDLVDEHVDLELLANILAA